MIMERSTKCFCSGPKQRKKIRTRISEIRTQMKHSVKKNCVTIMKAVKHHNSYYFCTCGNFRYFSPVFISGMDLSFKTGACRTEVIIHCSFFYIT
jgi:hypothetical protein